MPVRYAASVLPAPPIKTGNTYSARPVRNPLKKFLFLFSKRNTSFLAPRPRARRVFIHRNRLSIALTY